jgi:hypothetical protein
MRRSEITLLAIGLALPFVGNLLGAILYGEIPFYLFRASRSVNEYLWLVSTLEVFQLIPVILCVFYCKASTVLKRFRYAPVVVTYLFIVYCHYEAMVIVATPGTHYTGHAIAVGLLMSMGLAMWGPPFLSIPVFFVAFLLTFLINLLGIRRRDSDEAEHCQIDN